MNTPTALFLSPVCLCSLSPRLLLARPGSARAQPQPPSASSALGGGGGAVARLLQAKAPRYGRNSALCTTAMVVMVQVDRQTDRHTGTVREADRRDTLATKYQSREKMTTAAVYSLLSAASAAAAAEGGGGAANKANRGEIYKSFSRAARGTFSPNYRQHRPPRPGKCVP